MINRLDDLVDEATKLGFTPAEIGGVVERYRTALIRYDDAHKKNQPQGIPGRINYEEVKHMTAYAVAKKYIRTTVDEIQRRG